MSTSESPKQGLFLDFDGTLADTLAALRKAYGDFLAAFGRTASDAEFQHLNGPPLRDVVEALREAHGLPHRVEDLHAQYDALLARSRGSSPPAAGARTVLERARATGRTVAVVTSGDRDATSAWLARVGFDRLVAVVVGGDDVGKGKPDPEPYLLALRRTGCSAAASLAVEDSELGALAAIRAGLPTLVIGAEPEGPIRESALFRGQLPTLQALVGHL